MTLPDVGERPRALLWRLLSVVPVTVLGFAAVSGYLAANGVGFWDVFVTDGLATMLNPFVYTVNMLFHVNWEHYAANMRLWIPFGVVLTWLTSDKHVFGLVVTENLLTSVLDMATKLTVGVGMSSATLAVVAATLVRSTGYAMQNASKESLRTAITGLLVPALGGLFLVMVVAGPSRIDHFAHFLGFLFGGAIEAMYVFGDHEPTTNEREIPRRIGR